MAVITISRQFGAGGKTLAELVAARLDYEVASEEIIEMMAEMARLSTDGIRAFEAEDVRWEDAPQPSVFSPKRFVDRIFDARRKYMDGPLYVSLINKIIPQIAEKGNTVIVGRGAQFMLKSFEGSRHVLLIAAQEDRLAFLRQTYDLSQDEALKALMKQHKRRQNLMRLFKVKDYDQPQHYDLVINMDRIPMERAVALVVDLAELEDASKDKRPRRV